MSFESKYLKYKNKYLDLNNDELQVCLIEKPKPTMRPSLVKDGFHLIFNNIYYELFFS